MSHHWPFGPKACLQPPLLEENDFPPVSVDHPKPKYQVRICESKPFLPQCVPGVEENKERSTHDFRLFVPGCVDKQFVFVTGSDRQIEIEGVSSFYEALYAARGFEVYLKHQASYTGRIHDLGIAGPGVTLSLACPETWLHYPELDEFFTRFDEFVQSHPPTEHMYGCVILLYYEPDGDSSSQAPQQNSEYVSKAATTNEAPREEDEAHNVVEETAPEVPATLAHQACVAFREFAAVRGFCVQGSFYSRGADQPAE